VRRREIFPSRASAETACMMAQVSSPLDLLRDVIALTKPRLSSLVLCTTAGGIWLAHGTLARWSSVAALVGTTLAVAGAHALNCYIERDIDRFMARTRGRPLPAGRLEPRVALVLGIALAMVSIPLLWVAVNPITAVLGALALGSYVLVYTPMKTRSPTALYVGAVPGALPPLMGWTAATGRVEGAGLVLFAILFLWQLPHFLAIAIYRKDDYAAAGMKTLPIVRGDAVARRHIALWTLALVPVSFGLPLLGVAGWFYSAAAAILGGAFVVKTLPGLRAKEPEEGHARGVFLFSLVYLTGLFLALIVDAVLRGHGR
jgi:protoheme IX farnesyltransferase